MFKNGGNQKKLTGYVRRTCIIGYEVQSKFICNRSFGRQMKTGSNNMYEIAFQLGIRFLYK